MQELDMLDCRHLLIISWRLFISTGTLLKPRLIYDWQVTSFSQCFVELKYMRAQLFALSLSIYIYIYYIYVYIYIYIYIYIYTHTFLSLAHHSPPRTHCQSCNLVQSSRGRLLYNQTFATICYVRNWDGDGLEGGVIKRTRQIALGGDKFRFYQA